MPRNRKLILDKFQKYVENNFTDYCQKHKIPEDVNCLLTYLIDHNIISSKEIQKYTIKNEFENLYPKNEHQKTKTVIDLAGRFNLSERSVWNVLRKVEDEK